MDVRMRVFGPKPENHKSVGTPCAACNVAFKPGDMTALVPLGPGAHPEAQADAKAGQPYNAVAVEIHAACAGAEW